MLGGCNKIAYVLRALQAKLFKIFKENFYLFILEHVKISSTVKRKRFKTLLNRWRSI